MAYMPSFSPPLLQDANDLLRDIEGAGAPTERVHIITSGLKKLTGKDKAGFKDTGEFIEFMDAVETKSSKQLSRSQDQSVKAFHMGNYIELRNAVDDALAEIDIKTHGNHHRGETFPLEFTKQQRDDATVL